MFNKFDSNVLAATRTQGHKDTKHKGKEQFVPKLEHSDGSKM